ncbi:inner membrane peptidase. Serine peptidase. MEROPS family S49 [Moraxella cuniculi DSM 21768]|uniref:Inner membrane peptidase. Serine peptidase. MEROPS family S49 n=1 Tax=Moraxella cuniculi DSM 21768 TaxID=1122245 RepID=A0A1N7EXB6_9GAMM|nr:protease SohB [Moraxella cuniculi]OOS02326.1 protease SohB [Moraxella cuniculi]SIR92748.1 inner membrane peptidase. Serine peptidase. MEROPS family S49 [Moraxella cuniculi DSM 21768]
MLHFPKKLVELQIIHLNKSQQDAIKQLENAKKDSDLSCQMLAKLCQKIKKNQKQNQENIDNNEQEQAVYVLDFDGDIKASAVAQLREEISTIISAAAKGDEVVLRLKSGGGQVHSYGLAAAQLARIKQAGLDLTICVDEVAASGGYMMACTADKIIASDFAIIGSVGVVSQLPNFHEFLKKHDVQFEQFTAGEYKRTVTMFGENTDEDRAKHQEDLERIHQLFKDFVKKHRPSLDVEKIATGEIWFGSDAKTLGLVDEIGTSDAYLLDKLDTQQVYALHSRTKPTLAEKLGLADQVSTSVAQVADAASAAIGQWLHKFNRAKF